MDIADKFKRFGYTTSMVYLTLESVEQSTIRVEERVLNGGHFVDLKNILLNYNEGLQYLERFADRFDKLKIIHGLKDRGKFQSLLSIENQQVIYLNNDLPENVAQTVINIADRYRNISRDNDEDEEKDRGYSLGR